MKRFIKFILETVFNIMRKITPTSVKKRVKKYLIMKLKIINITPSDNTLHIAVLFNGGFGDVLIANGWITEMYRSLNHSVEIDVFANPDYHCLFYLMPYKIKLFEKELYNFSVGYDLKLEIAHFVKINQCVPYKIINKDKKLLELLEKINVFNNKYNKFCSTQPSLDGEWANLIVKLGQNRRSELVGINETSEFCHTKSILHLDINKYIILDKLDLRNKQYITVHAGSETAFNVNTPQTKVWLHEHYNELCRLIKQHFPDLLIIQLGGGNSLPIKNIDTNCLNKLSMSESIIVLKHSLLHIDIESGLVHTKRDLHGKSLVLFGPTPINYFGYSENININTPFHCTNCMWMMEDWRTICMNTGLAYPAHCMEAITPQIVMEEFIKFMDIQLKKKTKIIQTDHEIYSTGGLNKYNPILTDICNIFEIEKLPISEHIYYSPARFYIHASKQWEYPFAIDKIEKYGVQTNKKNKEIKIADVGGGAGLLAPYLAKQGFNTSVFDLNFTWDHDGDPECTEKLRLRLAETNGLKMEYGSIFNIPAEDETYDVVTCISVLEHIPEKYYAFKEMLRVLRPGGILILTYNLVDSVKNSYSGDSLRIEIFTPELINETLSVLGVKTILNHSSSDIQKALEDTQNNNVSIPNGITVGGFVLRKETI